MTPCILYTKSLTRDGYGKVGSKLAHRVAWEAERGPILGGLSVLHRCDVRNCINVEHLFLGTQQDNIADMIAKGRAGRFRDKRGTNNPKAKINGDDVWAIRWVMLRFGMFTLKDIARSYGVHWSSIYKIRANETWQHITQQWPFDEVPDETLRAIERTGYRPVQSAGRNGARI